MTPKAEASTLDGNLGRAWRWHLQLTAERVFSPFRIFAMVGSAMWWLVGPHPPKSNSGLEWAVLLTGIAYALVNDFVLRRDLAVTRNFPIGTVLADWAFIAASLWASGGRGSPFQIFIVVGVVATSLRFAPKPAFVMTFAYLVLSLLFGDLDQLIPDAMIICILGFGVALWADAMQRQHIAAVRDPLTGAYSRDFGLFRLDKIVARARLPFVVGVIDVDGFKAVNDRHGHAAGDIVLRQVSHVIASALRSEDFFCRTGGDEFMTLFSDVDAPTSAVLGERLRVSVEALATSLRQEGTTVLVTISVGLAEAAPGVSAADLLKAADDAMYAAKQTKNCVVAVRCADCTDSASLPPAPRALPHSAV